MSEKEGLLNEEVAFLLEAYNYTQKSKLPYASLLKGVEVGMRLDLSFYEVNTMLTTLESKSVVKKVVGIADPDFSITKEGFNYLKKNKLI